MHGQQYTNSENLDIDDSVDGHNRSLRLIRLATNSNIENLNSAAQGFTQRACF